MSRLTKEIKATSEAYRAEGLTPEEYEPYKPVWNGHKLRDGQECLLVSKKGERVKVKKLIHADKDPDLERALKSCDGFGAPGKGRLPLKGPLYIIEGDGFLHGELVVVESELKPL
jgi:hypothetical protein